MRTFSEWEGVAPGALQADLVLQSGERSDGFHLTTLVTVDVVTGWIGCQAVWGKETGRVSSAVHHLP